MKEKAVPAKIRRYILNIKEHLRRGVLTFEYLSRRTAFQVLPKKVSKIRYGDLGRIKWIYIFNFWILIFFRKKINYKYISGGN